jgi:4-coumarate--CoA ligase
MVSEAVLPGDLIRETLEKAEAGGAPHFEYRTLAHLPIAHIAGLQGYLVNPFYAGGLVYWMPKFDFQQFMDYNKRYRITLLFSVPAIYLLIAKSTVVTDQFESLLFAQSGAAPLGPEVQKAASVKLGKGQTFISQTWGLSETTGSVSSNLWGPKDETGSVGLILPNLSLRYVAIIIYTCSSVTKWDSRLIDEAMNDVEPGMPGEILVKGPVVSKGYYNNPAATAASLVDGWFCTGDIGILRGEKLYIVDRKKVRTNSPPLSF